MPYYIFENQKTKETKEIFFHMNDEKRYFENGVEWKRVYLASQVAVDATIDPCSESAFSDKIANSKGTVGDCWERSAEMSAKRAQIYDGKDPVKEKLYSDYKKKTKGKTHFMETREKNIEI